MLTVLWQTKTMISFPLEDIHVVNEHHAVRKSHDATHKKNVLTWCLSVYGLKQTRGIKNVFLKAAKKLWVSQSTGKSNTMGDWPQLNLLLAEIRGGGGGWGEGYFLLLSVWTLPLDQSSKVDPASNQGPNQHRSKGHRALQTSPPRQCDNPW